MEPSTGLFPPGKGGGISVAYGRKGKGILIHCLVDGNGMPLSTQVTAANADEKTQVVPLIDNIKVKTGKPGRPRKHMDVIAGDKGYDSKKLRIQLRRRGIRAQFPKRIWNGKRKSGRPIKMDVPRYQIERTFSWFQRKYRRLVVRWERKAECFNAFLLLAVIHLWLPKLLSIHAYISIIY